MSKNRNKKNQREQSTSKKKVVSTSTKKVVKSTKRPTSVAAKHTKARTSKSKNQLYSPDDMLFGRENYILMVVGLVTIIIGFMLMSGGNMPDANTWDTDIIYSFRRITLAPLVVIIGLIIEIVAIFKKPTAKSEVLAEEA